MTQPPTTRLLVLAFLAIYIIWGSTYLLNKIAVAQLAPFMLAAVRFGVAGLVILAIATFTKAKLSISKKQLVNTAIAGFLFLSFGNGVVVWALKYVDTGFAALEIAAQPLVVLLMMLVLQNKAIKGMSILGIILGIIGMYLLVGQEDILNQQNTLVGALMIFACMISWAYGSLFVGKADLPANFFVNSAYQMLFGAGFLIIMSIGFGEEWVHLGNWESETILVMALLIVFGSIVAFTSFNYLLKHVSPEKVATNTYVNPIIALFLGWYFLDESIPTRSIIAAVVLLSGVYFINSSQRKEKKKVLKKNY